MKDIINDYIAEKDWRVSENANQTFSLQGLNNHIASTQIARYWLSEVYPSDIALAHRDGRIHIHDLGTLGPYCVGWDLQDLLRVGFRGVPGKVTSLPARHFRVALMHVVNFLYSLQGEAAGAMALSNFDTLLAPFIRYDRLDSIEVKQALQEFVYNMNVPTRVGFQTPFTNITLDLAVPSFLANMPVIIGGVDKNETYGEFQYEVDMFNRCFAEAMLEGDALGRPFTFPIPTYSITNDFDWDNPAHRPIWEMTAKYGIPYFSNFVGSDMKPEDVRSMCCRIRLDNRELRKRGGGLFGANPLTGSIGVVTINMPRIAYECDGDIDRFFSILGDRMKLARDSLGIKRKVLEQLTRQGLYPYTQFYLRNIAASGSFWRNHFSTIGLIGMNEAVLNLFNDDLNSPACKDFAVSVLTFMRERLQDFQEDTGDLFNLEATPAEGASYRLAKEDLERCPHIGVDSKIRNPDASPYYTNSTHLPVNSTADLFEALSNQDSLQCLYTGGTVFHAFLGERLSDIDTLKRLIRNISSTFRLPYFTITPTFSICPVHGYLAGEHSTCDACGSKTEVYSRVVGYLRPVASWNRGKAAEFEDRVEYDKS